MNKSYRITAVYIMLLLFFACRKDKPGEQNNTPVTVGEKGVYITNEGNYGFANAKVSYYDPGQGITQEDLFQPANKRLLGDVCQSMYVFNNKAYLVINNSGKIEVVDPKSFISTATIKGLTSPRYFLPVSNAKAYVSDLKSNSIAIVDLNSNTISGNIPCKGWTEELHLAYGKAFVTNEQSDKVTVVNTLTDAISDSITVGYGSNSIQEDKNGKLWVLCSGKSGSSNAGLYRINPVNNKVEHSLTFSGASDSPWRLRINGTHDTLYFLNNGVYRMPVNAATLPVAAFIASGTSKFYGLGIDPASGLVYVADAVDYVQRGVIYRYKADGTMINKFFSAINPGDFYFN